MHALSKNRRDSQLIKTIRTGLCVLLYLCPLIYPQTIYAENKPVTIIYQSGKTFAKKIVELTNKQLINNNNDTQLIPLEDLNNNIDSLPNDGLIITFGIVAAEYALKRNHQAPVISFLIPRHSYKALSKTHNNSNWIVNFIDHPIERQLLLIKHLLGNNKTIGTILGPGTRHEKSELENLSKSLRQRIVVETISTSDHLISSLKLLTNKIDVLLALPDPIVFNSKTIRGTLLLTYRKNIPMIGFSRSYVKAGAIASLYSDSKQISDQAYRLISEYIKNNNLKHKRYHPDDFHIAINDKVAHSLGINTIDIEQLITRIKRDERK